MLEEVLRKIATNEIQEVSLVGQQIDDTGATALAKALANNKSVHALHLANNNIGIHGIRSIAKMLETNTSIRHLGLSSNPFGDEGVYKLTNAIQINNAIVSLNLSSCGITSRGLLAIADLLLTRHSIHSLSLDYVVIGMTTKAITAEYNALRALMESIAVDTTLHSLSFAHCYFGSDGVSIVADMLRINRTLKSLDISGSYIDASGMRWLADALKVNKVLKSIRLNDNPIGVEGGKYFVEMIQHNSCLAIIPFNLNDRSIISQSDANALQNKLSMNVQKGQLLIQAAEKGDLASVEQAVEGGSCLSHTDGYRKTALQIALEKNHENVARYLRQTIKSSIEPLVASNADSVLKKAQTLLQQNDVAKALEQLDEAILLNYNSADYYYYRAEAKRRLALYEAAIADYDNAIRINPDNENYYADRAGVKFSLQQNEAAITDYNKAILINPNEAIYFGNRGRIKLYSQLYDEAIRDLDEAIRLKSDVSTFYGDRASAEFNLQRYEFAITDLDKAIQVAPKFPIYYVNRALAKFKLQRYQAAIADYDQAIQIDSKNDRYYYYRAEAKRELLRYESAIADYDEAIKINPHNVMYQSGRGLATGYLRYESAGGGAVIRIKPSDEKPPEKTLENATTINPVVEHHDPINPSEQTILQAVEQGDLDKVKEFLGKDLKLLNTTDAEGRNPLMISLIKGFKPVAREILDRLKGSRDLRAIKHAKDKLGNNALHLAAKYNHLELLEDLILIDQNKNNSAGQLPLHLSVLNNNRAFTIELLKKKTNAPIDLEKILNHRAMCEIEGESLALNPLQIVVAKGDIELADILIKYGAKPKNMDDKLGSLLHIAVRFDQLDMFNSLVQKHNLSISDTTNKFPNCLIYASTLGRISFIHTMYESKTFGGNDFLMAARAAAENIHIDALFELNTLYKKIIPGSTGLLDNASGKGQLSPNQIISKIIKEAKKKPDNENQATFLEQEYVRLEIMCSDANFKKHYDNLVISGGGAKGIAFIGALKALAEKDSKFLSGLKRITGTSAGAITAAFLATGFTVKEIEALMKKTKFTDFLDYNANIKLDDIKKIGEAIQDTFSSNGSFSWRVLQGFSALYQLWSNKPDLQMVNIFKSLCSGEEFRKWLERQISAKILNKDPAELKENEFLYLTFGELAEKVKTDSTKYKHLHAMTIMLAEMPVTVRYSSEDDKHKDIIISDAIRASMSIPFLFHPHKIYRKNELNERVIYSNQEHIDGGLTANYAIEAHDELRQGFPLNNPVTYRVTNEATLGLFLSSDQATQAFSTPQRTAQTVTAGLYDIFVNCAKIFWNNENVITQTKADNRRRTIYIDPLDISTEDFDLNATQIERLIESGKNGVNTYLKSLLIYHPHSALLKESRQLSNDHPGGTHSEADNEFVLTEGVSYTKDSNAHLIKPNNKQGIQEIVSEFDKTKTSCASINTPFGLFTLWRKPTIKLPSFNARYKNLGDTKTQHSHSQPQRIVLENQAAESHHIVLDTDKTHVVLEGFNSSIHVLHKISNSEQSYACEQVSDNARVQFTDQTVVTVSQATCHKVMDRLRVSSIDEVAKLQQHIFQQPSLSTLFTSTFINGAVNAVIPELVRDVLRAQGMHAHQADRAAQGIYYGMLLANGFSGFTVITLLITLLTEVLGSKSKTARTVGQYTSLAIQFVQFYVAFGCWYALAAFSANTLGRMSGSWAEKQVIRNIFGIQNNFFAPQATGVESAAHSQATNPNLLATQPLLRQVAVSNREGTRPADHENNDYHSNYDSETDNDNGSGIRFYSN